MLSAKLLIPIVGLGVLALVGSSSEAKAESKPKPGANATPPADMLAKIAAAFQAADPAQLRKLADEVEAAGFKAQADDLRAFAKKVEDAIKATPVSKPPSSATLPPPVPGSTTPAPVPPLTPSAGAAAGAPMPTLTLPEVIVTPEVQAGPDASQRLLAGKTALMLRNVSKGKEDKGLVMAFQEQEAAAKHAPLGLFGTAVGKVDGLYGPKTALVLARYYGIVPPKPLYWSAANWLQDKKNYRSEMAKFASVDPQRADEWSLAGKVL